MTNPVALLRAADFAARRHAAQRRKGESEEPYVNHLIEVAALLAGATGGDDETLLIGALLHDAIEDAGVTAAEIADEFGAEVAALVREVSDDKELPKEERKRLNIVSAPDKSRRAKLLKIADMTSNVGGLAEKPPADWSVDRIDAYVVWAEAVFAGCRGVDQALDDEFEGTVRRVRAVLAGRDGAAAETQ